MGGVYDSLGWVIEMALPEEDTKKKKKRVRQAEKKLSIYSYIVCASGFDGLGADPPSYFVVLM
jgi:hypothetical protein